MADKYQLKAILTAVDKITPTTKQIGQSVRVLHKTLRDVGTAGGELMRKIGVPAFLSFSAVTFGAIRATKAAMEYAGGIQDAAERTGASVENYQALSNMLGLVGGSAEDAEMAFTKFNKGVSDAAAGADKNFAGLMKKLKIPLKDAKGGLVSLTDILPDLAAGFERNTDPAKRTRIAMELFGKGGTKMIPILARGRDGVKAWIKEQERLGVIVSSQSVAALDDFGDSTATVHTQLRALLTNSLAKLVPILQPIVTQMSEWIAANKDFLQTEIVSTIKEIATAIKQVDWVAAFKSVKETVGDIKAFIKAIGGVKTLIYGLGISWAAGPIAAMMSIVGAIWRLRLAFTALSVSATASGAAVAGSFGTAAAASMASNLGLLARSAGLLGAAALVGWGIGTAINNALSDATKEKIGEIISRALSAFGSKQAAENLKLNGIDAQQSNRDIYKKAAFAAPGVGQILGAADYALSNLHLLNNNKTKVQGEMTVKFENAPAGMRVEKSATNLPSFSLGADVGYRPGLGAFSR